MKLELIREEFTETSTIGKLYVDGKFECYILEDCDRFLENPNHTKVYGQSAIPAGTYEVVLSMSNRFKKELPELLNVPRFEGIRIHNGNFASQSEGCLLTGSYEKKDFVGDSKIALDKLMAKLRAALKPTDKEKKPEKVTITIKRKGWDA